MGQCEEHARPPCRDRRQIVTDRWPNAISFVLKPGTLRTPGTGVTNGCSKTAKAERNGDSERRMLAVQAYGSNLAERRLETDSTV